MRISDWSSDRVLFRSVDALGDDLHRSRRDDVGEAAGDRVVDEAAVEREPVVFRISGDQAVGADGAGVGAVQSRVGEEGVGRTVEDEALGGGAVGRVRRTNDQAAVVDAVARSEENTSELPSLMSN